MQKAGCKHPGPCEHVVQFYNSGDQLLDTLEDFLGAGLREGESVLVIATGAHLNQLERRLGSAGIDLVRARAADRYIPLDAERLYELFMVAGKFDIASFFEIVGNALARCKGAGRGVRVYGELVAVMWAHKHYASALQLEEAWQEQARIAELAVLCAYPFADFSEDSIRMIPEICALHTDALFQ